MVQDSPSRHQDQFLVRLPDGMRDRLKAAAAESNRSMNAEIVARLDWSFQDTTRPMPSADQILYVVLDGEGIPTSWPEVMAHLESILKAKGVQYEGIEAKIIKPDLRSSTERDDEWYQLAMAYREKLKAAE